MPEPVAGTVILGLDPGSRFTGYGVIERRGSSLRPLGHGRISLPTDQPLAKRLAKLSHGIQALMDQYRPEVAVLESLFHGVNVRSLIVLAQARGALLATLARAELEICEYSPAEIKTALTGHGRAEKGQVSRMVSLVLGLKGAEPTADASDALAAAICYAQRLRLDRLERPRLERPVRRRTGGLVRSK